MALDPTLVTQVDALPTDLDATYPDLGPGDARKLHQQHHDTLHEFAQAVADELDAIDLSGKADLVGGFVPDAQIPAGITRDSELAGLAPLDSPTFTGTVTLPSTVVIPDGTLAIADTSGLQTALDAVRTTVVTNAQTGTTYTLVLTDAGKDVRVTNASAITLTIPPNSSVAFPVDTVIGVIQYGAGQITVTPGSGVTLNSATKRKTPEQYAAVTLKKIATDEWLVLGGTA